MCGSCLISTVDDGLEFWSCGARAGPCKVISFTVPPAVLLAICKTALADDEASKLMEKRSVRPGLSVNGVLRGLARLNSADGTIVTLVTFSAASPLLVITIILRDWEPKSNIESGKTWTKGPRASPMRPVFSNSSGSSFISKNTEAKRNSTWSFSEIFGPTSILAQIPDSLSVQGR